MYGEGTWLEKEDKEYGFKYGASPITNSQVIRLNDYLVSKGTDSVICFKNLGLGDKYLKKVDEMIEDGRAEGRAEGIISAAVKLHMTDVGVLTSMLVDELLITPKQAHEYIKKFLPEKSNDSEE